MKKLSFFLLCAVTLATASLFSAIESSSPITSYQILFSPDDHLATQLASHIDKEQKRICVAVYCLSHRQVVNALIRAHKRGVKVEVIVDPFSLKMRSNLDKLAEAGVPVFIWNAPVKEGKKKKAPLMHDKFCVFGQEKVWTGSFNFTYDGDTSNRENAVVLESLQAALEYKKEFDRLKQTWAIPYKQYLQDKVKK